VRLRQSELPKLHGFQCSQLDCRCQLADLRTRVFAICEGDHSCGIVVDFKGLFHGGTEFAPHGNMNKDIDSDKASADGVIYPYPALLASKDNFQIGSLMWIDGQPMAVVAVEDDEQYGFKVYLKKDRSNRQSKIIRSLVYPKKRKVIDAEHYLCFSSYHTPLLTGICICMTPLSPGAIVSRKL
jgi:hypothetical protein